MANNPEFTVHTLTAQGKQTASMIAEIFDKALTELSVICFPGREFSIVKTKMEEACFFAKKSITKEASNVEKTL